MPDDASAAASPSTNKQTSPSFPPPLAEALSPRMLRPDSLDAEALEEKIYDAEFAESPERLEAYADFAAIVKQLRRDCPWDREQTHASVKHLLIEEAYEVVDAIDREDGDELAEELGDVFLHVLFHARIAEEDGRFSIEDVLEAETEKLIRRHPHVFGDRQAGDADEVLQSWEEIKQAEREEEDDEPPSALDGVPQQLPALLQALRIQEKAAGVGFDFPDREGAWEKVEEELAEFRETIDDGVSEEEREAEFGDLLFALVNYARFADVNPENALRATNAKFTDRFSYIERRLREDGRSWDDVSLADADVLWEEAKEG
jgi:XTP/dITP diphosphohydrolase/tetrapyrrole methylase family protein/MazG family protein